MKYTALAFFFLIVLLAAPAENLPRPSPVIARYVGINCSCCVVCMRPYRDITKEWWPQFYYWETMWIAGSDKVGTLYFYKRPLRTEDTLGPLLFTYESNGKPDPPEKAVYLPRGDYLVLIRGECFSQCGGSHGRIYFYLDDGYGPCGVAETYLDIGEAVVGEPTAMTLRVSDSGCNPLPGASIQSEVVLPDGSAFPLAWMDQGDGTYTTAYTPTVEGSHTVKGTLIVKKGMACYKGQFEGAFEVSRKKLPDLVIRNEDVTVNPEPELGDTVTVSVTVWNIGNKEAENFWVVVLINDEVRDRQFVEVLGAGEKVTLTYEWKVIYSDGYVIQAIADPWEELL